MSDLQNFFEACPSMLFVAHSDGALRHYSRALEQQFGHRFAADASLFALIDEAGHTALDAYLGGLMSTDAPATCTLHVPEADGTIRSVRCVARADASAMINGQLEFTTAATTDREWTTRIEHTLLHAIMNAVEMVVWAVDRSGKFVVHDGKALAQAGLARGQLLGQNIFELYPPESVNQIRETFHGKSLHTTSEAHGLHWETWNIPLTNDADEVEYCAGISLDVTSRVEVARSLEQQLQTIKRQQQAIHELSAPVLNVWDHVLAVPLIGAMDGERTDELTNRLLGQVHRFDTRFAILDLTGVEAVDTSIASHVLRLLGSLRLLGVEGLVTGVSPQVARTMVSVGVDFDQVVTHRTLREGLRYCMRT